MTFGYLPPPVIVDASVAIELLEGSQRWDAEFQKWLVEDRMLLAPSLFLAEVANGSMRSRRRTVSETLARLDRTASLGVEITDRGIVGIREAVTLAELHGLTVYDALYLQLAIDVEGELATLDAELLAAAAAEQVPTVSA